MSEKIVVLMRLANGHVAGIVGNNDFLIEFSSEQDAEACVASFDRVEEGEGVRAPGIAGE